MTPFEMLTDRELIAVLRPRGYIVRHKSEGRKSLDWNRTAPFPDGLDFKAEAFEKIRGALTPDLISFHVETAIAPAFSGDIGRPEIHRATLRVL